MAVSHIRQSIFLNIMEQANYERCLLEIQQLKKSVAAEKLAHEATLNQLESSYDLNQELQSMNQRQAKTISALNQQISHCNAKIEELDNIYDGQIAEMKELIAAKDHELAGIRASLMVTDYDVIRLRVINELQMAHKEQVEGLEQELKRIQSILREQEKRRQVEQQKVTILKQQLARQAEDYELSIEEKERKFHKDLNNVYGEVQKHKMYCKDKQRLLEAAEKKIAIMKERHEADLSKAYETSTTRIANHSRLEEHDSSQVSRLKESLASWQEDYESLKRKNQKEEARLNRRIDELERKLREQQQEQISLEEHLQKLKKKDQEIDDIVKEYERRMRNTKMQYEDTIHKLTSEKNQTATFITPTNKENTNSHNLLEESLQEIKRAYELNSKRQSEEIEELRKKLSQKDQRPSKGSASLDAYRAKLTEANRQIVNLLKEKIVLKEEIAGLKTHQ